MTPIIKRFAIVAGLWTLLALCGGATDYLLLRAAGSAPSWWSVVRRPLTEQWIWAALTPFVLVVAQRFPLSWQGRPWRSFGVHAGCFLLLSLLHCVIAQALGSPLASTFPGYQGSLLELRFLEELYSDIWMYWPLVCIQALIDSHARVREREKRANELEALLASSRLALLRAQIQPHFLFNTLHAISALLRIDARLAEDMVADLAEILRASFSDLNSQDTSLKRELDLVRCYLRIQSKRLGDRLCVCYHIAPDTLDASVPVLVLQSFVENAVVHGITPAMRPGKIEIRSVRSEDRLILQVIDDGVGLGGAPQTGVGISSARRRLQHLYGKEQSIDLKSRPGRGTSVEVSIPFRIFCGTTVGGFAGDQDPDADRGRRDTRTPQPVVAPGS
jgi:two-component sensor histidine kinase